MCFFNLYLSWEGHSGNMCSFAIKPCFTVVAARRPVQKQSSTVGLMCSYSLRQLEEGSVPCSKALQHKDGRTRLIVDCNKYFRKYMQPWPGGMEEDFCDACCYVGSIPNCFRGRKTRVLCKPTADTEPKK